MQEEITFMQYFVVCYNIDRQWLETENDLKKYITDLHNSDIKTIALCTNDVTTQTK